MSLSCDKISDKLSKLEVISPSRARTSLGGNNGLRDSISPAQFPGDHKFVSQLDEAERMVNHFLPLYRTLVSKEMTTTDYYHKAYPIAICTGASGIDKLTFVRRAFGSDILDRISSAGKPDDYADYLNTLISCSSLRLRLVVPSLSDSNLHHYVARLVLMEYLKYRYATSDVRNAFPPCTLSLDNVGKWIAKDSNITAPCLILIHWDEFNPLNMTDTESFSEVLDMFADASHSKCGANVSFAVVLSTTNSRLAAQCVVNSGCYGLQISLPLLTHDDMLEVVPKLQGDQ